MAKQNNNSMSIDEIQSLIQGLQNNSSDRFPSMEERVSDMQESITKIVNDSKIAVKDHYGNSLTATGTQDKVQSFTNYGFSNDTLNWTLWLALYNDSWVFRRAIDKPAQDEVNAGITIHGKSDFSNVYKAYDKHKSDFVQLLSWGALFGGSVAVIMFDGIKLEEMDKPLQKDKIKNNKTFKLYVTDRWYGCYADNSRIVGNMKDIDYGKPAMYEIVFANGQSYNIHHSYVLRYEHRWAPPLIKRGQLMGWGYAEGAHILNELSRDDQLKSAITSLVNKSLIEVIKMSGMRGVFMGTDKGNEAQLRKRLEMVNWGRSYNSLTFLDKDDEYSMNPFTGLSGLSDLLEKNMWLISSALEMQGILFGDLKGGLSQESDALKRYAITIINRCNSWFRPVINKFLKILYIVYEIDEPVDFEFNNLNRTEENKAKVESIGNLSRMLSELEQNGIISKYQYALTLKDYMNNDAINIIISDEQLNKLKLEEEQAILDTIKDIGKKRPEVNNYHPQFSSPSGSVSPQMMNQNNFEEDISEQNEEAIQEVQENNDIGENINEETSETPQE